MFLYKFGSKVFTHLKKQNTTAITNTKKVEGESLIDWLKSEFSQTGGNRRWNFKSICEQQKKLETKDYSDGEKNVNVPAARLCFVDPWPTDSNGNAIKRAQPKGYLDLWQHDSPGYEGFNPSGSGMSHYNHKLWGYFQAKNPGKE